MKIIAVILSVLLVSLPVLAQAEFEHEGLRFGEHEIEKAIGRDVEKEVIKHAGHDVGREVSKTIFHEAAEQLAPHVDKIVTTTTAAPVVKTTTVHGAAAGGGHLLSSVIVGVGIASIFIVLLVYDLTHPSAPAFTGQEWDTCANATINHPNRQCRPFLDGRTY